MGLPLGREHEIGIFSWRQSPVRESGQLLAASTPSSRGDECFSAKVGRLGIVTWHPLQSTPCATQIHLLHSCSKLGSNSSKIQVGFISWKKTYQKKVSETNCRPRYSNWPQGLNWYSLSPFSTTYSRFSACFESNSVSVGDSSVNMMESHPWGVWALVTMPFLGQGGYVCPYPIKIGQGSTKKYPRLSSECQI